MKENSKRGKKTPQFDLLMEYSIKAIVAHIKAQYLIIYFQIHKNFECSKSNWRFIWEKKSGQNTNNIGFNYTMFNWCVFIDL